MVLMTCSTSPVTGLSRFVALERSTTAPTSAFQGTALSFAGSASSAGSAVGAARVHAGSVALADALPGPVLRDAPV